MFEHAGTLVRLARHQPLVISPGSNDCSYLVRSGTIALETSSPRRHIVGFWHEDDLLDAGQLPELPHLTLRAVETTELWRMRGRLLDTACSEGTQVRAAYQHAAASSLKRLMVVNTMLGSLSGEERAASFLASTAVRLGRWAGSRVTVPTPMSRSDIADHIGLNPDTLSRIITDFREAGLIELQGRHTVVIRDWRALCSRTPLAAALSD